MFSGNGLLPGGDVSADAVLRTTDGGEFRVHRVFLRAMSDYFSALFHKDHGPPRDALISGVKGSALETLLTFLYTGELDVNSENVLDVLEAADMLVMLEAREKCLEAVPKFLTPENCLSVCLQTRRYRCAKLTKAAMAYARDHFDKIWRHNEDFENTPPGLLHELLASPELNVQYEADVLDAIARWYSAAGAKGSSRLPELLLCVRVGRCEPEALEGFRERWPVLAERDDYNEAISEALKRGPCKCSRDPLLLKLLAPDEPPPPPEPVLDPHSANQQLLPAVNNLFMGLAALAANLQQALAAAQVQAQVQEPLPPPIPLTQALCNNCGLVNPERWLPRLPTELMFVVGGWSKKNPQSTIQAFDNSVNRWFDFKTGVFEARAYHAVVQLQRRLYVIGGYQRRRCLRSVHSFDLDTCEWKEVSPMTKTRAYHAGVAMGEYIYAIGGRIWKERTRTAERYHARTNQWTMLPPMYRKRSGCAACVFKDRLYVSGGYNGKMFLESIEEYSPSLNCWSMVRGLPGPRCSHRMIVHCGRIYVIGGYDGERRLKKVIRSGESLPLRWREMPTMINPRSTFTVAQLGNDIYVIGGYNGTSLVADVECYTPGDRRWRKARPLNAPCSAACGCTVRGLEVCKKFSARGAMLPTASAPTQ